VEHEDGSLQPEAADQCFQFLSQERQRRCDEEMVLHA
jgi:hypothetical protein